MKPIDATLVPRKQAATERVRALMTTCVGHFPREQVAMDYVQAIALEFATSGEPRHLLAQSLQDRRVGSFSRQLIEFCYAKMEGERPVTAMRLPKPPERGSPEDRDLDAKLQSVYSALRLPAEAEAEAARAEFAETLEAEGKALEALAELGEMVARMDREERIERECEAAREAYRFYVPPAELRQYEVALEVLAFRQELERGEQ